MLAFRTANAKTHTPGVINRSLIRAKNDARKAAERMVRPAYQRIRTDPQIPNPLKVGIGVKLTARRRRHVGPPVTRPTMLATTDQSGRISIQVFDSDLRRKAKPKDVAGFELFHRIRSQAALRAMQEQGVDPHSADARELAALAASIGEAASDWSYVGYFTASPITIAPLTTQPADEVTLVARWTNRTGVRGPLGNPKTCIPQYNPARDIGKGTMVIRRRAA